MSFFPLVVSYYTQNTMYQIEVKSLIESCEKWNLAYHIEAIDSFGSWELNCAYKPFFLLGKLQEFKRPLFWVDADGVFLKAPSVLPEFSADIAARVNRACGPDHPSKVMSSSVFVNHTPEAAHFLRLWAAECHKGLSNPDRTEEYWDQMGLRDAFFSDKHSAKAVELPHTYVTIEGHPEDENTIAHPVVKHFQASRRYKKLINEIS